MRDISLKFIGVFAIIQLVEIDRICGCTDSETSCGVKHSIDKIGTGLAVIRYCHSGSVHGQVDRSVSRIISAQSRSGILANICSNDSRITQPSIGARDIVSNIGVSPIRTVVHIVGVAHVVVLNNRAINLDSGSSRTQLGYRNCKGIDVIGGEGNVLLEASGQIVGVAANGDGIAGVQQIQRVDVFISGGRGRGSAGNSRYGTSGRDCHAGRLKVFPSLGRTELGTDVLHAGTGVVIVLIVRIHALHVHRCDPVESGHGRAAGRSSRFGCERNDADRERHGKRQHKS